MLQNVIPLNCTIQITVKGAGALLLLFKILTWSLAG